jgi:hypothetical protein
LENTLDRLSAYGTYAGDACDGVPANCAATVTNFSKVRVFDSAAEWRVLDAEGNEVRGWESIGSEINATGKAVYGYGLRLPVQGVYTLQFKFPNVTITSVNYGTFDCVSDPGVCITSLDITVVAGGGGGGGGH